MRAAGIQALAVHLPDGVRTNSWWGEELGRPTPVSRPGKSPRNFFDAAMNRYLDDPFFGGVQRRVVTGEGSVELGVRAARRVLTAAEVAPDMVDGLISVSMFSDRIGGGDAGYLAEALGTGGGAFSIEATCSGSLSALLTACAWVRAGLKEQILVVATALMSRAIDSDDVTARLCGDAAAAFLVGPVADGYGLLGADTLHTGQTCGTWLLDTVADQAGTTAGGRRIRLRVDPTIAHVLRVTAEPFLLRVGRGALTAAGLGLHDVDMFVVNTPTAWHAEFSANALGVDLDRVVDTFPQVANTGPVLMPLNAYTAAADGRIKPGDIVLLYTFGGQAEACAAILRWPQVVLGPAPALPLAVNPWSQSAPQEEKSDV